MMNRRMLLVAAPVIAFAGCTSLTPSQLAADVQTVAAGLSALPGLLLQAGAKVSAAVQAQISAALADLQSNASAIAVAATTPIANVQAVVSDINLVGALVTPFFPAAAAIVPLVDAAVSLIGTILAEAGIVSSSTKAAKYSPDQARLLLRRAVK